MKNRIFMTCIILVLSASTKMYGFSTPKVKANADTVIMDFIASHMNTDVKKFDNIFDENGYFKVPHGEKVLAGTKSDFIDCMKISAGVHQNCEAGYEVLAKSDALVIARVDFNYENGIQHNYLILEKNADKEWKITQVCEFFDSSKAPDPIDKITVDDLTAVHFKK